MVAMNNTSLLQCLTSKASAALLLLLLLLLIYIAGQTGAQQPAAARDSCTTQLANLNTCTPFVVPGAAFNVNSSMECCSSVQSLQKDCLCNFLRLAAKIPASCRLPPIICTGTVSVKMWWNSEGRTKTWLGNL